MLVIKNHALLEIPNKLLNIASNTREILAGISSISTMNITFFDSCFLTKYELNNPLIIIPTMFIMFQYPYWLGVNNKDLSANKGAAAE